MSRSRDVCNITLPHTPSGAFAVPVQANTPRQDGTTRRRATPTSGGDPTTTPDCGALSPLSIRPPSVRNMGTEKDVQHYLFKSLELCDISRVREALEGIASALMEACLLRPSKSTEFRLRTPLMAAAATGDIAIFQVVMNAVSELFSSTNAAISGLVSCVRWMRRELCF